MVERKVAYPAGGNSMGKQRFMGGHCGLGVLIGLLLHIVEVLDVLREQHVTILTGDIEIPPDIFITS